MKEETPGHPTVPGAPAIASPLVLLPLAARRLARAPAFTSIAVLTLALALGAHVAVFGLVRALFLQAPPVVAPESLVTVHESRDSRGFHPLSYPDFLVYRDAARSFSGLAAAYLGAPLDLRLDEESITLDGAVISPGFFPLLGIEPLRGRFFDFEGDSSHRGAGAGGEPVVVLSEQLWRARFGAADEALGRTLPINGTAFTVVGVAPASARELRLGSPVDAWISTAQAAVGYRWCDPLDPDCTWLSLVGRLAPGRTLEGARAELAALAEGLRAAERSNGEAERGVSLAPLSRLHPGERDDARRLAGVLSLAVTLLLAVAAASLGGLLVARGLDRRREIAIRLALGGSPAGVVGLFLAESLLLGLAGGLGGLWTATWFAPLASRFWAGGDPLDLSLGPATVGYALALSAGVGLAVGLVPGLQARRSPLPGMRGRPLRGAVASAGPLGHLLAAQVALAMVLLTGTVLLARTIETVGRAGAAQPDRVATLRLRPRLAGIEATSARASTREVLARLEGIPGVRSVSLASHLPPGRGGFVELPPADAAGRATEVATERVAPRFFATLGAPLLGGRDFRDSDREGAAPVAIANRALAEALGPGLSAVGRTVRIAAASYRVVGVVDDAPLHLDPVGTPAPQLYLAYWQDPTLIDARLVVATNGPAAALLSRLRAEATAVDPRVPVTEIADFSTRLRGTSARARLAGTVLAVTGALSLFLCALCLHGVLALRVARSTRELGIRAALGATRGRVIAVAVRHALVPIGAGLVLGTALALAATRGLERDLYTVSPRDPIAFAGAALALVLVAVAAGWRPARRATRIDPAAALRQ